MTERAPTHQHRFSVYAVFSETPRDTLLTLRCECGLTQDTGWFGAERITSEREFRHACDDPPYGTVIGYHFYGGRDQCVCGRRQILRPKSDVSS